MKRLLILFLVFLTLFSSISPVSATTTATTPPIRSWNDLTPEEQKQTECINYISDRYFYYEPSLNSCVIYFSLKDSNKNYIAAPVIVSVRIENDYGKVLYEERTEITMKNFSRGSAYRWDEGELLLATVPVKFSHLHPESLRIFLYVEQYNGYYFAESEIQNNYLKLTLPQTPYTLRTAYHGAEISKFNYRYTSGGYLHVYMTGVMKLSTKSYFSPQFALLDSEGYQVATSNGANNYSTGTKFKDFDMSFGEVDPGSYFFK